MTRAESVVHAPTHHLFMARARVELGDLVEAKEAYLKIINEQLDEKAPPAFVQAQEDARAELDQLQGRLASLKIVVTVSNHRKAPDSDHATRVIAGEALGGSARFVVQAFAAGVA